MPKKPSRNAYYFFMLDYKSREEKLGRRFPGGMKEVATAAAEEWKRISPHTKDYYTWKAKAKKNEPRPNIPKPLGNNLNNQLEREKAENERMLFEINSFVQNFVNEMDFEKLNNKLLYLIHVNYFCKTDDDIYYPAELAIAKFNLKHGVRSIFHRYINPGEIATGYSFVIKEHGDMTHKIPLSFVKSIDNSNNLSLMYNDICEFLLQNETNKTMPPLFTMYDNNTHNTNMTAVKQTLQRLWKSAFSHYENDNGWEHVFKVYPLPLLFWRLKNKCYSHVNSHKEAFPDCALAEKELQKDTYSFYLKNACSFHQSEDAVDKCSKSYVLRWAFIIQDHCCKFLGIDTDGHHEHFDKKMFNSGNFAYSDNNDDNYGGSAGFSSANRRMKRGNDFDDGIQNIKKEKKDYGSHYIKKEEDDCTCGSRNIKKEKEDYDSQNINKEKDYDTSNIKKEKDDCTCGSRNIKEEEEGHGSQNIKKEKDNDILNIKKEEDECTCGSQNIKKEKEDCGNQNIKKEKETYPHQNIKEEKEGCGSQNIKKEKDDCGSQNITKEMINDSGSSKIKDEKVFDPTSVKIKEEKMFDNEPETSWSTESCSVASTLRSQETKNVPIFIDDDFPTSAVGVDKRIKLEIKQEKIESPTEYR